MAHRVLAVVGARPNFVKVAPVVRTLGDRARVLHTGQHYDHALSGSFLQQLQMPEPWRNLGVGSGTHAEQTAGVLVGVEKILAQHRFDLVLVPGDVNSTLAAALAAAKAGVPVAHLEAGLRSGDWTMPEEINRVVTDRVSDLLLCHSDEAVENLRGEGIAGGHVELVGNTMIDSLLGLREAAATTEATARLGLEPGGFALVTLHRPALVDDADRLGAVLGALARLAERLPVVLPMHPRTRARLQAEHAPALAALRLLEPLAYLEFACLQADACLVVTDSGGVQEETSALGVPCVTYRTTTERPVTVRLGTNRLVGLDPEAMLCACSEILDAPPPAPAAIPLWDGRAGVRAAEAIVRFLDQRTVA